MMHHCLASGGSPLTHVVDHPWYQINDGQFTLLSNHIIMMVLAAVLLLFFLPRIVRVKRTGDVVQELTPTGGRNLIEAVCAFLRDVVAKPNLGPHTDRFVPYVWTTFFFILTCNVLGLLPFECITRLTGYPIYGTATGNIYVTGTLATCTFFMIVVNGLRLHGMTYVKHFFMGPFPINLLIAVLEVVGLFVKAIALAIRLFANMCAGHILLAVLLSFIFMAGAAGTAIGFAVAVPVVIGSVAIMMLELFVAFLQAFIFTFLSCVFIGQAVNIHHDEGHSESGEKHETATAH